MTHKYLFPLLFLLSFPLLASAEPNINDTINFIKAVTKDVFPSEITEEKKYCEARQFTVSDYYCLTKGNRSIRFDVRDDLETFVFIEKINNSHDFAEGERSRLKRDIVHSTTERHTLSYFDQMIKNYYNDESVILSIKGIEKLSVDIDTRLRFICDDCKREHGANLAFDAKYIESAVKLKKALNYLVKKINNKKGPRKPKRPKHESTIDSDVSDFFSE